MNRSLLAALVAVLALGLIGAPLAADEHGATYGPPFAEGPAGGDAITESQRDDDGRITVARVGVHPGGISCPGGGAFAKWEVEHELTGPVETIRAEFTESLLDSFVFVLLSARDADGEWLGSEQLRGPAYLDGAIDLPLDPGLFDEEEGLWIGDTITIQFGLEMSSACPHVNAGTARFTEIIVS